jgi:FKBP-type peptidyl-prolyl cis-trans isomerase 2
LPFSDGDFVRIDYSAWRIADNGLTHTTIRRVAEENGMLDKDATYAPQLVIIGKGSIIKGVEDAVRSMSVNESKTIEIGPKEAFGERDPDLVKVLPIGDFRKRDITPYPGMRLYIDNTVATVKSVNSGRVVVDANHPLAGERLRYEIRVVDKIDKDEDRVQALAEAFSLKPDSVEISGGRVRVAFGENVEKNSRFLVNKADLVNAVMSFMANVERVVVEEDYARPKKKEEAKAAEEKNHQH